MLLAPGGSRRSTQAESKARTTLLKLRILISKARPVPQFSRDTQRGRRHAARVRIPVGIWKIVKEILRHMLRRPVVGIAAAARTRDGRWLLIRRADSGQWALPGGTLEWGENLRDSIRREVEEETGARVEELGWLVGVYSAADRDPRFHAVTVVVHATVSEPDESRANPAEISEVRLFTDSELPTALSHGMTQMLSDARAGNVVWE
jgi:8-oxo-dGTP diphosphatase